MEGLLSNKSVSYIKESILLIIRLNFHHIYWPSLSKLDSNVIWFTIRDFDVEIFVYLFHIIKYALGSRLHPLSGSFLHAFERSFNGENFLRTISGELEPTRTGRVMGISSTTYFICTLFLFFLPHFIRADSIVNGDT